MGAGDAIPTSGKVFISVRDFDKGGVVSVGRDLQKLGFELVATRGTAKVLEDAGISVELVNKVEEGRPHIVDAIKNDEIAMVVNTTEGKQAIKDSASIRRSAEQHGVYYTTTLASAEAVAVALEFGDEHKVRSVQELHARING